MRIHISGKFKENIDATSVLQQTAFWSRVKNEQGIASQAFKICIAGEDLYGPRYAGQYFEDDLLILFQQIEDGRCIGYVPYGPKIEPDEDQFGIFLEELSESLRLFLPPGCILLRYDLRWRSLWVHDDSFFSESGEWRGPPRRRNQELRMNFATHKWNLKKANTDILPSDTIFIDLRKNEERLLASMRSKTRYNIRLSQRKGVQVHDTGTDRLDLWYDLYRDTCRRNGIFLHPLDHFRALVEAASAPDRGIHRGKHLDYDTGRGSSEVHLLIAEADEKPSAAMFLVMSGGRATYLYGASSSENRNYMSTYALQWEAIRKARERGCTEYDMFGISPTPNPSHPLYGLYRFKTGFGGYQFHRMGCWDYPFDHERYGAYMTAEMKSAGYHIR
jgi:hypothetical protein